MKKFDFHCHSLFSDGTLSPAALVEYAHDRHIEVLALTDHDCIDGLAEAQVTIEQNNYSIQLINGVEISALTDFGEIHIVGLNLNLNHQPLIEQLKIQQEKRWQRAKAYDQKLQKAGVIGVFDRLQNNVKQVVTRTHIAKAIVELGFAKDMQQAFKRYIGKQGRIKVTKDWMTMAQAIKLIQQSGGVAIMAHPTRYPISNRKLSLLIEQFSEEGGDAIELSYPSLNPDKMAWLKLHQEKNNLIASSGSDFHYPNLRWTDLGRFPYLDHNIPHVYHKICA
jgi:3',5'-nucleoside bisphosphate phosphatase